MGNNTYDRYSMFRSEGTIKMVPTIKLKAKKAGSKAIASPKGVSVADTSITVDGLTCTVVRVK